MAESNRQLRLEFHEVQKAAEGQVAYVARQAELDRDRAVRELQMLGAKLEAAHQQLKNSERVASMAGSISFSSRTVLCPSTLRPCSRCSEAN